MRILFLATVVAVATFALPVDAASTVEVRGTLAGWAPPAVAISVGDTVRFSSLDVFHPPCVQPEGAPVSTSCLAWDAGTTNAKTFTDEGTFTFFCKSHPWMRGVIQVS